MKWYYLLLFSCSVMSDSLQPQGLQHARLPCPSSSGACSNSCLLSRWRHPTILPCVVPFSSCLQFFPTSGSFPMSLLFASGGQSIGGSSSASVLPMNIQGSFPLGLTGLISLQSMELSRVFSSPTVQKYQFFGAQLSLWSNSCICTCLLKNHSLDYMDLCQQSNVSGWGCWWTFQVQCVGIDGWCSVRKMKDPVLKSCQGRDSTITLTGKTHIICQ